MLRSGAKPGGGHAMAVVQVAKKCHPIDVARPSYRPHVKGRSRRRISCFHVCLTHCVRAHVWACWCCGRRHAARPSHTLYDADGEPTPSVIVESVVYAAAGARGSLVITVAEGERHGLQVRYSSTSPAESCIQFDFGSSYLNDVRMF